VTSENLDRLIDKSNLGYPVRPPPSVKRKKQAKTGKAGGKKRGDGGKDDDDGDDDKGGKGGKKKAPNTTVAVPARFKAQGGAKGTAGRKGPAAPATPAKPAKPAKPGRPPRSAAKINSSNPDYSCFSAPTSAGSSPRHDGVATVASLRLIGALTEVQPTRAIH
jgi:hypothetical protein